MILTVLVLSLYVLFIGTLYVFQKKLIFLPEEIDKSYSYNFLFDFEEVNLTTSDNETINALHIKAENPKGILLYFHGNEGSLTHWGETASYFTQYKYDVFLIDYRGYGKSTGAFNEHRMYEDALLSYKHLKKQFPEDKIIVYGRSLGTTFATKVASENTPKHLILEAPFYNLHSAANHRYKVVPKFLLNFKFNTHLLISKVQTPVTIFHGTKDKTTPFKGSKQLYNLIVTTNKELILLEKGAHHTIRYFKKYTNALKVILD
jgi:alpha-beta hydrolase superfamily lysophospholipase